MSRMSWFSLIAGVTLGAVCARALEKRKEIGWKEVNKTSGLQNLSLDFLQAEENTIDSM